MALSVGDCKEMISVAKDAGVILAVGHMHRRLAGLRKAKELIDRGAVGEVLLIEGSHANDRAVTYTPEMWQWYRKDSPGGPLCPFNIHHADVFNYLVGPVKRVTAFINRVCGKTETDDVVSAAIEFESGALGYLGGTFVTPHRRTTQIHGIEGLVLVDDDINAVYYQKKGTHTMVEQQSLPSRAKQMGDALAEEIDAFASCILEGGRPETAGEEGLAAWAVIEAIIKSAESGSRVEIKDLL
jgi:predicted dehydrogenase